MVVPTWNIKCATCAAMAIISCASLAVAAPPQLNYFFPAGVQRGQTATITAVGTFGTWPVEIWTDHAGVQVFAAKKKGELTITADENASCGLCWLRVYDADGASQLRPLIIGMLPETAEAEPNDAPDKPQAISTPTVINGKLSKRGDVDGFAVELQQGQSLVAALEANQLLGSPMDAVLQIADRDGFVLAQNNDARGLDPLIVYTVPATGTYLVRTFAFPSKPNSTIDFGGGEDYVYRLTMTTGEYVDHVQPLAVSRGESTDVQLAGWNLPESINRQISPPDEDAADVVVAAITAGEIRLPISDHTVVTEHPEHTIQSPQALTLPADVSGSIAAAGEVDAYRFSASKGEKLEFKLESAALGFLLDAVLQIVDTSGKVLTELDDASKQKDPVISFTAPADGQYDVRVRDLHRRGGLRFAYRLTIAPVTPRFKLTLKAGEFTVTPGAELEIPVAITREGGLTEEIEISVAGLPEGVTAAPAVSKNEGPTAKEVKLKFIAAEGAMSGVFRIVGHAGDASRRPLAARFPIAELIQTHDHAWLTVTP